MPFDPDEARALQDAHPDQIILGVAHDGAQAVLLIPKAHKARPIRFGAVEIELGMLHGGTYWTQARPVDPARCVTAEQMVIDRDPKPAVEPEAKPRPRRSQAALL